MEKRRYSLYLTLGIIIIATVTMIMSINSTYNYINTKNKIIEDIKKNSRTTVLSLKNNVSNLIASYAVNEYNNLISNEINRRNIFAIIVEDYNMGKIVGEKSYISGKIRDLESKVINFDENNIIQKTQLENCYYSEAFEIVSPDGKKLGNISIYITDEEMNKELNKIIKETLINTIAISILLTLLLLATIHFFVLKPISKIIIGINNSDKDGIPIALLDVSKTKEISTLSKAMNSMIKGIRASRLTLKESENQLKYLLEMSPIAVRIAKDGGKKVFFANKAYSNLLKMKKRDTIDINPKDYYENESVFENIMEALENDERIYNKLVKLKIENKIVWALSSFMNIDFDGEKAVLAWFYDVTAEKETEVKLFEALELQTTILDNSGYLIIRTDKNGLIKQINKETENLLGYKAEELVDIHTPEILHLESECKQRAKEFSEDLKIKINTNFETLVAKSNKGLANEHEWTYITKEGKHIPVLLSISALRDKHNEVYGYLGISKDITQRKILESQSKLASMGEMIGNIAHQWRQPLSVISTISSGIKVKNEFDTLEIEDIISDMEVIMEQTIYLSNTIDDFRNFIKNTNKKEKISIKHTLEKALSILHPALTNNSIEIITNIEDDLSLNGFENQLIQSILNIVNNAKDALKENVKDEDKFIFIETKDTKKGLLLTIKDNAGGIEKEIIHKVFEPYFTTKHQSIGTGIGLSMVYQIITEHHNATIKAVNEKFTYKDKTYTGASFQILFKI